MWEILIYLHILKTTSMFYMYEATKVIKVRPIASSVDEKSIKVKCSFNNVSLPLI